MNVKIPKNGETKIENDKLYVSQNGEWIETEAKLSEGGELDTGMTLYDINKQIISQLPALTIDELHEKKTIINQYDYEQQSPYYMMLCNELKYYTVFSVQDGRSGKPSFWSEVIECLIEFADEVKSIEMANDNSAIEIWIKKDNEINVMYLFNYKFGVIDCER